MANFPTTGMLPYGAALKAYIDEKVAGRAPAVVDTGWVDIGNAMDGTFLPTTFMARRKGNSVTLDADPNLGGGVNWADLGGIQIPAPFCAIGVNLMWSAMTDDGSEAGSHTIYNGFYQAINLSSAEGICSGRVTYDLY